MSTRAEVAATARQGMRQPEVDLTTAGVLDVLWRLRAHFCGDTPLPDGRSDGDPS